MIMCQNYDSLKASKAVIGLVSGDLEPLEISPSDLRRGKPRVAGLPDGEQIFTIGSAVLTEHRL